MSNYIGSCACKAVQYKLQGEPMFTQYCHCNKCRDVAKDSQNEQDQVGYAFTAAYLSKCFELTQGESELEELPKNNALLYLCKHCHTQIYGISKDPAQREGLGINANTIEIPKPRPSSFNPVRHVYYSDRRRDINVEEDLPKFVDMPKEFGGSGKLILK